MGRQVIVYKPELPFLAGPIPGIVVLHESDGLASDMFSVGFEPLADAQKFMIVYPEMQVQGGAQWGYKSDLPFFHALTKRLQEHDFGLDGSRVFVCGHSAGGTMSLFLQNEMNAFAGAAAVESGISHPDYWDMSRVGHRTMIVMNQADPVLMKYAPLHDISLMYNQTVSILRRRGSTQPSTYESLPISGNTLSAQLEFFDKDTSAPELVTLSFRTDPGTHQWPQKPQFSFSASEEIANFFFENTKPQIIME
eukprot:gnl/TRDRNA2_/TRDRNA2_90574_c0_seq1.p1 gnl/TRDRNA2_/TRDRNA2_90574_c0~~gnl/TRDRNA2_/TRDRNA2_90574_c0_seq1.p1  ORF type:complete len:251 (+),score=29.12 gnl/TRDRNA2_/TRDRNA2_90574_c0_seq1:12-764(+)